MSYSLSECPVEDPMPSNDIDIDMYTVSEEVRKQSHLLALKCEVNTNKLLSSSTGDDIGPKSC